MEKLYPCCCCGHEFLEEYDSFEICPVCGWEDDGLQNDLPDFGGGANDLSLNEARAAWEKR